jgi:dihydrofolate synthase / folylpolyglutamate synthase
VGASGFSTRHRPISIAGAPTLPSPASVGGFCTALPAPPRTRYATRPMSQPDRILDRLNALYPKSIDLSLDRIRALVAALGDPQERLPPVAHVGGTNGKGSTIAYMRAALEAAGYRVHVYTSPHLVRFNERIRLAGSLIEDAALAALLEEVERVNAGRPITFFEITTAAAFLAFARAPADAVLLEVGLGGRLDATNLVARPAVSVLTPISLDHFDFLGDTIEKIAIEKAGILKPGVPAISAPQPQEAAAILDATAAAIGTRVALCGRDWNPPALPPPALPGRHQRVNAAVAWEALDRLQLHVPEAARRTGIMQAEWPARLQRLGRGPLVDLLPPGTALYLDGGHNESAGAALADWVAEGEKPVDAIVAMRANKALAAFLAPLAPHLRRLRAVAIEGDSLSTPPPVVAEAARAAGIADAAPAASVEEAVAMLAADPPRRLLVCGSLYLAGDILAENG